MSKLSKQDDDNDNIAICTAVRGGEPCGLGCCEDDYECDFDNDDCDRGGQIGDECCSREFPAWAWALIAIAIVCCCLCLGLLLLAAIFFAVKSKRRDVIVTHPPTVMSPAPVPMGPMPHSIFPPAPAYGAPGMVY
jgi:hypothetical protein